MTRVGHGSAEIGCHDPALCDKVRVGETRADPGFDLIEQKIGGYHRRQFVDVTIVDNLKQFFLRPAGCILRPEVIQDEQLGVTDFIETAFKGCILRRYMQSARYRANLAR